MKKILLLFLLITLCLEANEKRKIIVASFSSLERASKGLEKFISKTPKSLHFSQKKLGFQIKVRPSKNSFIVVLEPFENYSEARKVKELLPKDYHDAFINAYVPLTKEEKKKLQPPKKKIKKPIKKEKVKKEEIKILPLQKPEPIKKEIPKEETSSFWKITTFLFFIVSGFLGYLIFKLQKKIHYLQNNLSKSEIKIKEIEDYKKEKILRVTLKNIKNYDTKALHVYDLIVVDSKLSRAQILSETLNDLCNSTFTCKDWEEAKQISTKNSLFIIYENEITFNLLEEITESTTANVVFLSNKREEEVKRGLSHTKTLSILQKNYTQDMLLAHLLKTLNS